MMELRTCRICKEQDDNLLKYDVRHYGHYGCLLSRMKTKDEAISWIESLHAHQIRAFPVLVFADWLKTVSQDRTFDALDLLRTALKKVERREKRSLPC